MDINNNCIDYAESDDTQRESSIQHPRKRGRPRKNQQIIEKKPKIIKETKNDPPVEKEIILHLPLTSKDFMNSDKKGNNPSKNLFMINDQQTPVATTSNTSARETNGLTLSDISNDSDSELMDNKDLLYELRDKDKLIRKLRDELADIKNTLLESNSACLMETRVLKMKLPLISIKDGKSIIPDKSDKACMWCTYTFTTMPYFLPDKYIEEQYHVWGNFCNPRCAVSYNFNRLADYKIWERYSMFKKIYGISGDICEAPPYESYDKFGGSLSIEDYRKQDFFNNDKEYRIILPPMVSIIPFIEEHNKNKPINRFGDSDDDNLKIKRNKPLPNLKNTLLETMGITMKSSLRN